MNTDHQLMWLDEAAEDYASGKIDIVQDELPAGDTFHELEAELQRARKELADVRKDLAAKTVQLSRKETAVIAPPPTAVNAETERHIHFLAAQVSELESMLRARDEELAAAQRQVASQRTAMRGLVEAAAERAAAEHEYDVAGVKEAAAAAEAEVESLMLELARCKARAELELRAKHSEIASLKADLDREVGCRRQAVSAAEAALNEAWEAEVARMREEAAVQAAELVAEVSRVRSALEEARRTSSCTSLTGELAALNASKVAVQREFEAFREAAEASSRRARKDIATLLEENAALHSRLAHKTVDNMRLVDGGDKAQRAGAHHRAFDSSSRDSEHVHNMPSSSKSMPAESAVIPAIMAALEQRRKGLAPIVIVASVIILVIMVGVVRAAFSAHAAHGGPLCFLAKLGINIGPGCGPISGTAVSVAQEQLVGLVATEHRVHDVGTGPVLTTGRYLRASTALFDESEASRNEFGSSFVGISWENLVLLWRQLLRWTKSDLT